MKRVKKLYHKSLIFRFMMSYVGILLVPLLICLTSYEIAFNIVEDEIKENHVELLEHSQNVIDLQMKMVDSLVVEVSNNEVIQTMADMSPDKETTFFEKGTLATQALDNIFKYASLDLIDNVYVYLNHSDYVITRNELCKSDFYYKNVLKKDTNLENWQALIKDRTNYKKYSLEEGKIKVSQMFPFTVNDEPDGVVNCILSKEEMENLFSYIEVEKGTSLYIEDKEGELLFKLSSKEGVPDLRDVEADSDQDTIYLKEMDGEVFLVISIISEATGWQYSLVFPERLVMHRLTMLKLQIIMMFGVAILVGISICYYNAQKNGRPLEEMKRTLNELLGDLIFVPEQINNINSLSGTITQIVTTTKDLQHEIEDQKPYLEMAFFKQLLSGQFMNDEEMHFVAERAGIDLSYSQYTIVVYKVFINNDVYNMDKQTLKEVNMVDLLVRDYTHQAIKTAKAHFYNIDYLTTAVVIQHEEVPYKVICEVAESIGNQVVDACHIRPFWGIGTECTNPMEVWRSFEQALKQLENHIHNELAEQDEVVETAQVECYYPEIFEQKLMVFTKEADSMNITRLFEILYIENFEKRTLNEESISKLYEKVSSTLMKLVPSMKLNEYFDMIRPLMKEKNRDAAKAYLNQITKIYIEISMNFKQVKNNQQKKLITRILDYINEVYMDSNLGLGMIATEFNISEGYISSLFKEQTGVNFTDYVEKQRIGKACELLQETNLNINEISERVGYNSVQSFRRAFKRSYGISPSELRKLNKGNDE